MSHRKKTSLAVAAVAAVTAVASVAATLAFAGATHWLPVRIETDAQGRVVAHGALGTARNSTDDTQRIGCRHYKELLADGTPGDARVVECFAETLVAGEAVGASCRSYDAGYIGIAAALTSDSYLYFSRNAGEDLCTEIRVETASTLEPKAH